MGGYRTSEDRANMGSVVTNMIFPNTAPKPDSKKAVTNLLDAYILDEQKDHNKYLQLATKLREMGRQEDASAVYGISHDEERHREILTTIRKEIG